MFAEYVMTNSFSSGQADCMGKHSNPKSFRYYLQTHKKQKVTALRLNAINVINPWRKNP
jgi:hypothetical protein